jgi:hypothetical protein
MAKRIAGHTWADFTFWLPYAVEWLFVDTTTYLGMRRNNKRKMLRKIELLGYTTRNSSKVYYSDY